MQLIDGRLVYSASDLVGFLACEHLTNLERAAAAGLVKKPFRKDAELELMMQRGRAHEKRYLAELRAAGQQITLIEPEEEEDEPRDRDPDRLREAAARTLAALRRGDEVIYQAALFHGHWRGHADFLRRVETPSALGPWSYEVHDTKLARQTKAGALLQLCLYSDLLAQIQGEPPKFMHVALGGSERQIERHRLADYDAYYRMIKRQFEEFVSREPTFPPLSRPDPVEHCDVCRWSLECENERRKTDDLSLVAGITGPQRRGLREKGVTTRRALAELPLPLPWRIEGTHPKSLRKVREQARVQVEGQEAGRVLYELLDPRRTEDGALQPNLGLLALPEPSPGDLFLDIEGDSFALDDGVDYLFGVIEPRLPDAAGAPTFHEFWALAPEGGVSLAAEKRAFEKLINFLMDRLLRDPSLHIFHYASYDPAAIGRLMGRHATRESEVDRLFRGKVFVDLYRAVRQSLRASVESYSIKKLEPLYSFERQVDLPKAGESLVEFSIWLEEADERGGDPETLKRISAYNRDDCLSAWKLRNWLEARREELARKIGGPLPRPGPGEPEPSEKLTEHLARVREVEERLTAGLPADPAERAQVPEQQAKWLLAQLLSWHRREENPAYWRYFYLCEKLTDEERIEEPEPIGGLEYDGIARELPRSIVYRYRFPTQEHEVSEGRRVTDPATMDSPGTVVAVDNAHGILELKRGRTNPAPHPTSIVPELVVRADEQKSSLLRLGEWVVDHGLDGQGFARAGRELLLRRPPQVGQAAGEPLPGSDSPRLAAPLLALQLNDGCLAIQGPPGSGKTTTGAEMIVELVRAGKRVGVTANSHRVIGNLLDYVVKAAEKRKVRVRLGQKPAGKDELCSCKHAARYDSNEALLEALAVGTIDVAGATAWAWAREEFESTVGVLFVDEAGQVSLANVVAVAPAARSLVLLGDPQQLDQPLKGCHPEGAEVSALTHLLGDQPTMPSTVGLFLGGTWRLHPDICAFTSEVFYAGRLKSEENRERQRVVGTGLLDGAGLRYLPIPHLGNDRDSAEEATVVARLIRELLAFGATWIDHEDQRHPIELKDILVITPYNAQVRTVSDALRDVLREPQPEAQIAINVGTVDKFQGQQAPISIYSMATSTAEDAPRGMPFLYSLNRLNVATSRARCLAVVVASPELIRVRCQTPKQMRLANALCRFIEMAARVGRYARET